MFLDRRRDLYSSKFGILLWIRGRRSDVEKQLAYAVINTASKQHRDVRREKETRNNNILL